MHDSSGTIYLVRTGEFVGFDLNVFKIGKTDNFPRRLSQYPFFTQTIHTRQVHDRHLIEKIIILKFRSTFTSRRDFGFEYFQGDYSLMISIIDQIINKFNSNHQLLTFKIHKHLSKYSDNKHLYKFVPSPPIKLNQNNKIRKNSNKYNKHRKNSIHNIINQRIKFLLLSSNVLLDEYKYIANDTILFTNHLNFCNFFFKEPFPDKFNIKRSVINKLSFFKKFVKICNIQLNYPNSKKYLNHVLLKDFEIYSTSPPSVQVADELVAEYKLLYSKCIVDIDFTNKQKILEYLNVMSRDLFDIQLILSKQFGKKKIRKYILNIDVIKYHRKLYNIRKQQTDTNIDCLYLNTLFADIDISYEDLNQIFANIPTKSIEQNAEHILKSIGT